MVMSALSDPIEKPDGSAAGSGFADLGQPANSIPNNNAERLLIRQLAVGREAFR